MPATRQVPGAALADSCAGLSGMRGALHYIDEKNGVKDFVVWSFSGNGPFPYRWRGTVDYGPSKFERPV